MKTFAQLFEGRKSNYTIADIDPSAYPDERGKLEARYRVIHGTLDPSTYDAHLRGETNLGIVPIREDNTVLFACIDIDKYDDEEAIAKILDKIKRKNWPFIPTRSKSGGLHLWIFFKNPVSSIPVFRFICKIADTFRAEGLNIDTFPRQPRVEDGRSGSCVNLPYSGNTKLGININDGRDLSLEGFVEAANRSMVTLSDLEEIAEQGGDDLDGAPPCVQKMLASGIEEGGRNNAVYQISVYLSKAHPDDWKERAKESAANCTNPQLSDGEVSTVIQSVERSERQYMCDAEPMKSLCDKHACLRRKYGVGRGEQRDSDEFKFDLPIVKITFEDNPKYQITMYGKQFRVDADILMNYNKFRVTAMKYIDKIPPPMSKADWESFLSKEMALMKYEEPPINVAMSETIRSLFENWVNNNNSTSEMKAVKRQGCYSDGTYLWIDPRRLSQAISRETKLNAENIWLYLRNLGSIEEIQETIDGHPMMVYRYRLKETDDWFRPNRHRIEREDKPI